MRRLAGCYTLPQPHRPQEATSMKERQRVALGKRAPPAEEQDARVKCKDCGAFGHTQRSLRCPMKRGGQTLTLQPLGSHRKEKENLEPRRPTQPLTPGSSHKTAGAEGQRQTPEEKQAIDLHQKFTRRPQRQQPQYRTDLTESVGYIRRACRPLPVHAPERRPEVVSRPPGRPPVKLPAAERPSYPAVAPVKMPGRDFLFPHGQNNAPEVEDPNSPQLASRHFSQPKKKRPDVCPWDVSQHASGTLSGGRDLKRQAQAPCPHVNSKGSPQPAAKPWDQERKLSFLAAGKRSAQITLQTCQNLPKKPKLSPCRAPWPSSGRPDPGAAHTLQAARRTKAPEHKEPPKGITSTTPQVASTDSPEPHDRPHLNTVQACGRPRPPRPGHVPGQPLRMVFTRLDNGWWKASFRNAPSSPAPEEPTLPHQRTHALGQTEGQCSWAQKPVLYQDLLLSSSEESDWE